MVGVWVMVMLAAPVASGGTVRWTAPAQCPQREAVVEDIEGLSGTSLAETTAFTMNGELVEAESGYSLVLTLETRSGTQSRVLDGPDCGELAGAAATLAALVVERDQSPATAEPASTSDSGDENVRAESVGAKHKAERTPERWGAVLGLSGGAGLGGLPNPGAVVSMHADAQRRLWSLGATAQVWLPQRRGLSGAEGTMFLWSMGLRGCALPKVRTVAFPVCVGVEAGQLVGRGRDVADATRDAVPWLAAAVGAGVRVPVHRRIAVRADATLGVPVLRPGFEFDGIGLLHRVQPITGMFAGGVEFFFGGRDFPIRIPRRAANARGVEVRTQPADVAGPVKNLAEVFRVHHAFVWRSLVHLGLDQGVADDAVQDVFLVVHRRLPDFHGATSMRSWLYGIARRVASDYRRGKRRADRPLRVIADPDAHAGEDGLAQRMCAADQVHRLLESLDPGKREVFLLAEVEGLSAVEIAHALNLKINTVYGRIRLARKRFAEALKRQQAEEARVDKTC